MVAFLIPESDCCFYPLVSPTALAYGYKIGSLQTPELSHYQVRNYVRWYVSYLSINSNDENPAAQAGQKRSFELTPRNKYRATRRNPLFCTSWLNILSMDDVPTHSKRRRLIAMRASVLIPVPISKGQQMLEIHRSHRGFNKEHASPHICRGGGDSSSFKPGGWPAYWFVM